jgi:DNA-binding MarR family transcriptional regulator
MTRAKENSKMNDATIARREISLPFATLRDPRMTPELIGALALGLAYAEDQRPFPSVLREVGRMRPTTTSRVVNSLIALGYAVRQQQRAKRGFGPVCYRLVPDPQIS